MELKTFIEASCNNNIWSKKHSSRQVVTITYGVKKHSSRQVVTMTYALGRKFFAAATIEDL